jgi:hypothetical protein
MDAVGFEKAAIFASGEGGPAAIVFATTRPERTRALILFGSLAFTVTAWEDLERDPAEVRASAASTYPNIDEKYWPSMEQIARLREFGRAVRSAWGSGAALSIAAPSAGSKRQLAMLERMSASPGMARATFEAGFRIDIRPILPTLTTPTLVIHARKDPVPVQAGRHLADHIPGAQYLEVDGADSYLWLDKLKTGIEDSSPAATRRRPRHIGRCALCCSPTSSPRRHTPRPPATSGGGRCCTALVRSSLTSRTVSAARWCSTPATVTSSRSTARRRPSVAPKRCARTPRH